MSKKRKDNLESFFRKGLGAQRFEYVEDDWVELEAKLDEADRSRALFWRNVLAATAVVIGLALLLFNLAGDADLKEESSSTTVHPDRLDHLELDGEEGIERQSLKSAETLDKEEDSQYSPDDEDTSTDPSSPQTEQAKLARSEQLPGTNAPSEIPHDAASLSPSNAQIIGQIQINDIMTSAVGTTLRTKSAGRFNELELAKGPVVGVGLSASDMGEEPFPERGRDSRFALGLMLGPDVSSVGMSDYTSPGLSLGMNLEYYILSRLTFNGGLIVGTKKYMAKGREYGKGRGLWTRGVVPDTTMGSCLVLDIPINVRFYPVAGDRHRLFVSTGISSYIFLTEDYDFLYAVNAPDLIQGWEGKNEVQNYFGVVNLSLGYELRLERHLHLQVEPFFKLPLDQLGFGNVELLSTGVYFTLKYRFQRRRQHLAGESSKSTE